MQSEPMQAEEARQCVATIKACQQWERRLILELHDREGWQALGYSSWETCIAGEFPERDRSTIFRQLAAAQLDQQLPTGDYSEWQLRPLTAATLSAEQKQEAWAAAQATPEPFTQKKAVRAVRAVRSPQQFKPDTQTTVTDPKHPLHGQSVTIVRQEGVVVLVRGAGQDTETPVLTCDLEGGQPQPQPNRQPKPKEPDPADYLEAELRALRGRNEQLLQILRSICVAYRAGRLSNLEIEPAERIIGPVRAGNPDA